MIISSSAHEKKIAIIEDGIITEYFVEREDETQGLAGSLYKGRVMKVLPGMQSAFVDIGLDRDAFLYVSDFLEEEGFDDLDPVDESKESIEPAPKVNYVTEPPVVVVSQPTDIAAVVAPAKFLATPIEEIREHLEEVKEVEEDEDMSIIPLEDNVTSLQIVDEPYNQTNDINSFSEESVTDDIDTKIAPENALEIDNIDESAQETSFEDTTETLEVAVITQPEEVVVPLPPQVIIPPPSHDFIRIIDEPEEVIEAIVDSQITGGATEEIAETPEATDSIEVVCEATIVEEIIPNEAPVSEVANVVLEEEIPQTKRRRNARKEPAKKKAPALSPARKRGKKAVEEVVEEAETVAIEVQYERIVDDENPEIGELLKEAIIQHKIIQQLREEEENPILPVEKVDEPEVLVGSLQPHFQADPGLERIVDEVTLAQEQENNLSVKTDSPQL
ncbi:MAG: ribonuclease G, partial [bacterium]